MRIADGFDEASVVAFGLAAPQLAVAAGAAATAFVVVNSPGPSFILLPVAGLIVVVGGLLTFGSWSGRPLLSWAVAAATFAATPRKRSFVFAVENPPLDDRGGVTHSTGPDAVQPWTRWLHPDSPVAAEPSEDDSSAVVAEPLAELREGGDSSRAITDPIPHPNDSPVDPQRMTQDRRAEVGRGEEPEPAIEELPERGVILPFSRGFADEDEPEFDTPLPASPTLEPPRPSADAPPVFVGATRRVAFFALNGGTGRTTLATEVAAVLAQRGRHSRDGFSSDPLKVALIDLDLRSANVAVRLGIPHPTVWDYVMADGAGADDLDDYLVRHRSGLRALLGPPKPVSEGRAIEPAQVAEIVRKLESDGYHFIFFDVTADLSALTTWVLGAVHDIFVVLTATASGIQDAYRTTATLRRMGLRHKLAYVVNRSRGAVDLREVMGDLGGQILACIPYDTAVEDAENSHRLVTVQSGAASEAITQLAAHLYPPIGCSAQARRRLQLPWRRRAG